MVIHFFIMRELLFFLLTALILSACSNKTDKQLFEDVSETSGLSFLNELDYTENLNPYTYRNFYNGAGVALGDVNNDGLLDVYMTGNLVNNKLFINQGNWQFEEVAVKAGVDCPNIWSTGATFVDINADGWLDLYVCKSGPPSGDNRNNELFINQKDGTFIEQSADYGLSFTGLSTQAAFFDFDKDGDLDCYLLNNSIRSVGVGQDVVEGRRDIPDQNGNGNKLLRNDNGIFTDITLEAGIYTSSIGYGLGITLNDFNADGWTDIFISNDFFEKDYLYINNQKGGFDEDGENYFQSLSMGSMGADASDLNNDGSPELMVTEMLPQDMQRKKTKTFHETWDKYQLNVSKGYYHQFSRNVLQTSLGNSQYTEVGRLSGVSATEWSWGALIFDMDNDGMKDIFISNGIYKDLLDRDYLNFMANDQKVRSMIKEDGQAIKKLVDLMPSNPVVNAAYLNQGNLNFNSSSEELGLGKPSFSNGSAYGDLDNDGDLDLIVSNVNMPSFVYRNNTDSATHKNIRVRLKGAKQNTFAVGAKVVAFTNNGIVTAENFPSKGFQSSVDPFLTLGLGNSALVDSLYIYWPTGGLSKVFNLTSNKTYSFDESQMDILSENGFAAKDKLILTRSESNIGLDFIHRENDFVDFDRERLLFQMYDNDGPTMSIADVNGDGIQDIFVGGAKQQSGALFLGSNEEFTTSSNNTFELDSISEDTNSIFFDCDNDGDQDLYVASGGRAYSKSSSALMDRLYINDGKGNFSKSETQLPFKEFISTSVVKATDYDLDGDLDLFIGERFHPFNYGKDGRGFLFQNNGKGEFTDVTKELAPTLLKIGMVTAADWADVNGDGKPDLITVGDWQPVHVFINEGAGGLQQAYQNELSKTSGFWNSLEVLDVDNDGDLDFVAGNHGKNSLLKPKLRMYISDFDGNGMTEQIICEESNGKFYPIAEIDELVKQMPILKKKSLFYEEFAKLSIDELFTSEALKKAEVTEVDLLTTSLFLNENGKFRRVDLPNEAQYSPTYAIASEDLNGDGYKDLILGGNQFLVKPQFGRFDGSKGLVLLGSKDGFTSKNAFFLTIDAQIRDIKSLSVGDKKLILFAINNGPIEVYETTKN
jgi:enediyne biosynthesis protein E4